MKITKIGNLGLTLLLQLGVAGVVSAASFDCTKAISRIDKTICASPQLSKLDSELVAAYKNAIAAGIDHATLRSAMNSWLKESRNKCQDEQCLIAVYEDKLAALNGLSVSRNFARKEASGNDSSVQVQNKSDENIPTQASETVPTEQVAVETGVVQAEAIEEKNVITTPVVEQANQASLDTGVKNIVDSEASDASIQQVHERPRVAYAETIAGGLVLIVLLIGFWLRLRQKRNDKTINDYQNLETGSQTEKVDILSLTHVWIKANKLKAVAIVWLASAFIFILLSPEVTQNKILNETKKDLSQSSAPPSVKKRDRGLFASWGVESKCHSAFYRKGGVKVDGASGFRGTFENDDGSYSAIFLGYTEINSWGAGPQGWQVYKCDTLDDESVQYYMIGSSQAEAYMRSHK